MPTPGATISGFAEKSIHVGPRELKGPTVSSLRLTVDMWFEAPTVSTHGALPGDVMAPVSVRPLSSRPRCPAAATTTIPASEARRAACASGSSQYDSNTPDATDRLMTRTLYVDLIEIA